jgi:hypothetical protein
MFDNCWAARVKSLALPMNEIENTLDGNRTASVDDGLNARIFRVMTISVVIATAAAAVFGPWRVAAGLLLGGSLSLLNYRWLSSSIAAIIQAHAGGSGSGAKASRYILRYCVIAAVVLVAFKLSVVSLPATIIGLCSFVVALFAEAFRQFYLTIIHREGIN